MSAFPLIDLGLDLGIYVLRSHEANRSGLYYRSGLSYTAHVMILVLIRQRPTSSTEYTSYHGLFSVESPRFSMLH